MEGPTLADRIAQGPIPVDEALPIAKQIAEALEAAHEAGVIHRDLKPANIKVRDDGTVKVLDFGLAKALDTAPDGDPSQSPTLTAAATQMGVIMGTAAYMSPEQARGKVVDKRADVWAFGAVLFEMLTGRRAFDGEDVSVTLANVINQPPDWEALPSSLSPVLATYLRRCLTKEPKQRIPDIAAMRLAMEGAFETPVGASPTERIAPQPAGWREALPWVAGIVLAVVSSLAVWSVTRPETPRVVRFTVAHDDAVPLTVTPLLPNITISPNGEQLAYLTGSVGVGAEQLHVRPLAGWSSETLVADGQLDHPFFSADSQSVGFYDRNTSVLKRVAVRGGPASTICVLTEFLRGASWGVDDTIIFGTNGGGLWRVAAGGGEPEPLTMPDAEKGEVSHMFPEILPGGDSVLFVIAGRSLEESQIAVLSLDTLEQQVVIPGGAFPQYSPTGHLLYGVQGNLWAVGFDLNRMETVGDPVPVQEGVLTKGNGLALFSVSANGSLVYLTGELSSGEAPRSLVWVDRLGNEEPVAADPQAYRSLQLSPDDQQVVTQVESGGDSNLEVYDLARDTPRRFTFGSGNNNYPFWTPDGDRILWQSFEFDFNLVWKAADGTGQAERLTTSDNIHIPLSFSADGQTLVMTEIRPDTGGNIGLLSMDGEHTIAWALESNSNEFHADVSPEGRWMAYTTDESGQMEVYVTAFPNVFETRVKISQDGGLTPQWGADGRELFFQTRDGTIMVVEIETEPTISRGTPVPVFDEPYWIAGVDFSPRAFDISRDGQRLLVIKEDATTDATGEEPEIHVVLNWTEELTRLVPTP